MLMQNDMVKEIIFPERFLKDISIPLLKKMFSLDGGSRYKQAFEKRELEFRGSSPEEIPGMENIVDTLGKTLFH